MLFGGSGNDTLEGGPGADTLIGGPGMDTADYSASASAVSVNLLTGLGSGGDAQGDILGGIENIVGSAFNDTLTGGAGNDTLTGGAGNDIVDGLSGSDTAVYSGSSTNYQVTQNADGSWKVVDLRSGGPDGTDTLRNIEYLQFNDQTLAIGPVTTVIESAGWTSLVAMGTIFSRQHQHRVGPLAEIRWHRCCGGPV